MKSALLPLTSLRFFGAAAVVICHRPHLGPDDWLPYERHTSAVVTFFFLLSGFILAYTSHDRFVSRRPHARRDFLVARYARLLPAYLLAFFLALWTCTEGKSLLTLKFGNALWPALAHVTLTQTLVPDMKWAFAFNPPAWSLSCEALFYPVFPLLLLGLATGSVFRRLAVFAAASAAWAAVLGLYLFAPGNPEEHLKKWIWLGYVFPLTRIFDFLCGVALGVLFVRAGPSVGRARGYRYWAWGLAEVGALGALWATFHFCPWSPGVGGPQTFRLQMLSWQGYYLPALALLVWVGALGRGPLSRVLSWSPLVYLGTLSYGIYIFQSPVYLLVAKCIPPDGWAIDAWIRTTMVVGAVPLLAVAVLSYHFWESPIRRWVCERPSRPVADAAPAPALALPHPDRRAA